MPEIATFVPASFNAGDTVRWRMAPPGYSAADGWALECLFASASGTQQIGAAQDANGFTFTIAAAARIRKHGTPAAGFRLTTRRKKSFLPTSRGII